MKIALFTDSFLPGIGGTENVVARLATEYSKNNEVVVFAPNYHSEYEQKLSLPYKIVRAPSIKTSKNDFWAHPNFTSKVKNQLKQFNPDVIHTHTLGSMAGFANKFAKKHFIPVVCTAHTKYAYCYKDVLKADFLVKALIKKVIKRAQNADRVTAVCQSMATELVDYGLKKTITVVKNGADTVVFDCQKPQQNDVFTIVFVGSLLSYKNLSLSIKALEQLKKVRDDFAFKIIGRGSYQKSLKRQIKRAGLTDKVEFKGAISNKEELYKTISACNLCLFTSVFDNDSLAILECASLSVPTLAIKNTGSAERITDNENGFIEEHDAIKLANKINQIMSDKALFKRVSKNAKSIISPWQETAENYLKIYQEEIAKKQEQS